MVHYSKVVRGLKTFVDQEMAAKATGSVRSWVMGGAAELVASHADQYFRRIADNPMVRASGLIDGENVNVDAAIQLLRTQAQKGPAVLDLGWLGSWTFNAADVETLARMIQGA